jgi:taurine dioxygenase
MDRRGELDEAMVGTFKAALLKQKVIIFRSQDDLDSVGPETFIERMGTPLVHPNGGGTDGTRYLSSNNATTGYAASSWHTEMTYTPSFPRRGAKRADKNFG